MKCACFASPLVTSSLDFAEHRRVAMSPANQQVAALAVGAVSLVTLALLARRHAQRSLGAVRQRVCKSGHPSGSGGEPKAHHTWLAGAALPKRIHDQLRLTPLLRPQASPKKKPKGKRRHGKKSEYGESKEKFAPPLEPAFASECYAALKHASTATEAIAAWVVEHCALLVAPPREESHATSAAAAAEAQAQAQAQATSAELASLPGMPALAAIAASSAAAKPTREPQGAFMVLSVGCGDGELDLELLIALSSALAAAAPEGCAPRGLHYVGLEPNGADAAAFTARLDEARGAGRLPSGVVAYVLEEAFDSKAPSQRAAASAAASVDGATASADGSNGSADARRYFGSKHQFDLVVAAGVLASFRDTHTALQRLLASTRSGGRMLVVQPARGVPELQAQLMKMACGNESALLAADEVKRQLAQLKLPPYTMELVPARLHCSDCLTRNAAGLQVATSPLHPLTRPPTRFARPSTAFRSVL